MTGQRVLVVDDDAFTRVTLTGLLRSLGYTDVTAFANVYEAMPWAHEARPDLAIVDLDLGEGPTGIDLAHGLRTLDASIAIIVLTSYTNPTHAGQRRGLPPECAYLVKSDLRSVDVLRTGIEHAMSRTTQPPIDSGDLSADQWETLRLIAAGHTNAEIARRRSVSEESVIKFVTRLVRALGIKPTPTENVRVLLAREYFRRTGAVSERRD